ncbi:MAG: hypothetical protein WDN25_05900 [Acetobacteraceae bacterium]
MLNWLAGTLADTWRMVGITGAQPEAMPHSMDFTALMDIAGYRIVGPALLDRPHTGCRHELRHRTRNVRLPTRCTLERIMRRDALARPGIFGAVQRRIIRSINRGTRGGQFRGEQSGHQLPAVAEGFAAGDAEGSGPATADSDGGGDAE